MSVLTRCPYQVWIKFRENVRGFLSPGTTQTVRITQVSAKRGLTVLSQVHKFLTPAENILKEITRSSPVLGPLQIWVFFGGL